MIGERLKRARAAAGLSMQALADQVGVSAPMIKKYESNGSMPSSGVLIKLARAVGVRSEYFFRPNRVELAGVEYRKRASTGKKELKRIEADVLDQAERWYELRDLWPNFPLASFSQPKELPQVESLDDIELVSAKLRKLWKLGLNPLPDLIDLLESKGILVIVTDSEHADKFDGLQATIHGQPIIVVSSAVPGCRQRFTLAHELGHLILHDHLPQELNEEKACHRFASSFLLPAESLTEQLGAKRSNIDWQELYLLKQEYGLSMGACLYRCKNLGIISDALSDRLFRDFSKRGWRKIEPGDDSYPKEATQLFNQLVYHAVAEDIISESKGAELLKMPVATFRRSRNLEGAVT